MLLQKEMSTHWWKEYSSRGGWRWEKNKFGLAERILTHDRGFISRSFAYWNGGYTWRALLTRRALSGRSSHQWQSFRESSSIALEVAMGCGGGSDKRLDLAQTDRKQSVRKQKMNLLWDPAQVAVRVKSLLLPPVSSACHSGLWSDCSWDNLQEKKRREREGERELSVIYVSITHTSVFLMQRQKEKHGHCSYWTGALQCVQTGGAELTVSSTPPELQVGFLHLQHNKFELLCVFNCILFFFLWQQSEILAAKVLWRREMSHLNHKTKEIKTKLKM